MRPGEVSAAMHFQAKRRGYEAGMYRGGPIMPKQKTHKGVKKRFRLTARGKVKHRSAGTSHLNTSLSKKRRRKLRGTTVLHKAENTRIRIALGKYSY